jgi:hypothetical protein
VSPARMRQNGMLIPSQLNWTPGRDAMCPWRSHSWRRGRQHRRAPRPKTRLRSRPHETLGLMDQNSRWPAQRGNGRFRRRSRCCALCVPSDRSIDQSARANLNSD